MGCHPNISVDRFPEQGGLLWQEVSVCFGYNTERNVRGVVVRDDIEDP